MFSRRGILVLASVALVGTYLLGVGCDGDNGEPSVVTAVQVTPSASLIDALGNTAQFIASARDQNGNTMTGVSFTWSVQSMSVATVDQNGLATAVANGQTSIRATANGVTGSATLTVAQVPAAVVVTPDPSTLVYVGETVQLSAAVEDANGNPIANATVTWTSSDPSIVDVDAAGLATAVFPGSVMITGTSGTASDDATVTVDIRQRPAGDIVLYRNYDPWGAADTAVLNAAPFNYVPGTDYMIASVSDMMSGVPATTSLVILPSASSGDLSNQISDQVAAVDSLEKWVRAGGWLVVHGGDTANGIGYAVPGLLGTVDDVLGCTGQTLLVGDHAFVRGPDATLGTGDDLTDTNIDLTQSCPDNSGSLASILPLNAEVLVREEGGSMRPTYATYDLDAGRVIVTSLTLEYGSSTESLPTIINHFYWAINGLDAPAAPAPAVPAPSIADRPAAKAWLDSQRRR